ncbi:hypothetical protein EM20IM_06105 [Candidatus Methylacidiphilum infernorum]|uniref:Uncharacterized protein n=1 Tax=Candidatus Methylacidiphilum infernorum TaxID=511746 RepID=A0ABX7PTI5_9BACT|nr:hypothetical protein EM20IM_06105 [Candidatus Methylacidiphilum infernorum]
MRKPNSQRASIILSTQTEAIQWAEERSKSVFVQRVRNTKACTGEKWRPH